MTWVEKLLRAAAAVVDAKTNPGGFATLVVVLLFSATILLFRKTGDGARLGAFLVLVLASLGLTIAVFVQPPPIAPRDEPKPAEPAVPPQPGSSGWVYYEVGRDGHPTEDGQLEPVPSVRPMPKFLEIKRDQVLRAISAIRLRNIPPDTEADLAKAPAAILKTGTCVATLEPADPRQEVDVQKALSGGWLRVSTRPCPT